MKGHAGPPGIGMPGAKGDRGNFILITKNCFLSVKMT